MIPESDRAKPQASSWQARTGRRWAAGRRQTPRPGSRRPRATAPSLARIQVDHYPVRGKTVEAHRGDSDRQLNRPPGAPGELTLRGPLRGGGQGGGPARRRTRSWGAGSQGSGPAMGIGSCIRTPA